MRIWGGSSCLSSWGLHKRLVHFVDTSSDGPIMSWGMTVQLLSLRLRDFFLASPLTEGEDFAPELIFC